MPYFDVGDGREFPLFLPDDLTEEEIQNRIAAYKENFPLPTVEEETVATTLTSEEILPELIPTESEIPDPYVDIAPKLRPEESVDEGEPFRKQVIAGGASSAVAQMEIFNAEASVSNIAEMQNKADILKLI